jgi:hypothetical protein
MVPCERRKSARGTLAKAIAGRQVHYRLGVNALPRKGAGGGVFGHHLVTRLTLIRSRYESHLDAVVNATTGRSQC